MEPRPFIEAAIQTLINTKHLYQSVLVSFEPLLTTEAKIRFELKNTTSLLRSSADRTSLEDIKTQVQQEFIQKRWLLHSPSVGIIRPDPDNPIYFSLPPVKTMCGVCHSVESFNAWNGYHAATIPETAATEQTFCIPVQCQACRADVIVFLVHRKGIKLQLVGRSEFEDVQVPQYIPKEHKQFYSQALIAFNSGQLLPALFLLRTLIEQHMRATIDKIDLRGDELCDGYGKRLPEDFKERFPSLKTIYGKISDALHRAEAPEGLFESQLADIELHFDALALFAKAKR